MKYKPTHEQQMQEFRLKTARDLLYCCFAFVPFYLIFIAIVPNAVIPSEILDIPKLLASGILGFFMGYGSSVVPKS
jgi:hypothetical protein